MRRALAVAIAAGLAVAPAPARAAAAANDPGYTSGAQWGLNRIRAEQAWRVSRGTGAIVAVLDTGVDTRHPDLRGRLVAGRDFADGDADPRDDNGHGTLVAGIVAAQTSNGYGVASVAPGARIMPVRVLGKDGAGSSDDVARGIRWAARNGADVINLSLAQDRGHGIVVPDDLLRDPIVNDAIRDAVARGAVIVIAAGNDSEGGRARTAYAGARDGVLVVGASTRGDHRAAYSNYGAGLDLLAPGGGTATDPSDDACAEPNFIVTTWWNPDTKRSEFGGACGTSMAVAFVSGVAALLHARGMENVEIARRIRATADDIGPKGHDPRTGAGRLNAARAVGAPKPAPRASPSPIPTHAPPSGVPTAQSFGRVPVATTPMFRDRNDLPLIAAAAVMLCLLSLAHAWRGLRND